MGKTNFDVLMSLSEEQFGRFLCNLLPETDDYDTCDRCPKQELCSRGNNGFIAWLKKEAKQFPDGSWELT